MGFCYGKVNGKQYFQGFCIVTKSTNVKLIKHVLYATDQKWCLRCPGLGEGRGRGGQEGGGSDTVQGSVTRQLRESWIWKVGAKWEGEGLGKGRD